MSVRIRGVYDDGRVTEAFAAEPMPESNPLVRKWRASGLTKTRGKIIALLLEADDFPPYLGYNLNSSPADVAGKWWWPEFVTFDAVLTFNWPDHALGVLVDGRAEGIFHRPKAAEQSA